MSWRTNTLAFALATAATSALIGAGAAESLSATSDRLLPTLLAQTAADQFVLAGEIDGGSDPLDQPSGLAVSEDGTLYVIDAIENKVRVFAADGAPIATWGETGAKPGQFLFNYPTTPYAWGDIAIGPDGNVYVLDPTNSRVQKFTPEGEFLLTWGSLGSGDDQFQLPTGIWIDRDGKVHVADSGRVQVFSSEGDVLSVWDTTTGGDTVITNPGDIVADESGKVWVADTLMHQLVRFDGAGAIEERVGSIGDDPGELRNPTGMTIDAAGNLYVAEYDGNRVQIFGPDGAPLGIVGSGEGPEALLNPSYVTIAADGTLYVSDEGNHRVLLFRPDGASTPEATPSS